MGQLSESHLSGVHFPEGNLRVTFVWRQLSVVNYSTGQ